jgi:CPA2 family monovalent cation:H+ antiporter-2
VLEQARVEHARVMVVAISDPASSRRIVVALRKLNPNSCIFVRTRYIHEMEELYRLGATEVIPEELEASIEIFSRVLAKYLVPIPEIDKLIGELRAGRYDMLRRRSLTEGEWSSMHVSLADAEMSTFQVSPEGELVGKSLSETEVRQRFGISLLAIRRGGQMLYEMTGDTVIEPNDTLYIFGQPERVQEFARSAD